jgi:hypothetical protein
MRNAAALLPAPLPAFIEFVQYVITFTLSNIIPTNVSVLPPCTVHISWSGILQCSLNSVPQLEYIAQVYWQSIKADSLNRFHGIDLIVKVSDITPILLSCGPSMCALSSVPSGRVSSQPRPERLARRLGCSTESHHALGPLCVLWPQFSCFRRLCNQPINTPQLQ